MQDTWREDRRSHERVRSKGTARVSDGKHSAEGRIVDLSPGGVRISVEEPSWQDHRSLSLELRLDAATTDFVVNGHVCRAVANELVIAFDSLSPEVQRLIDEELVAARDRDGVPNVILVDVTSPTRTAIANAFREHGWAVAEVSTPLEAIRRIIDDRFEPSVIAIADTLPESVAEELREFLATEYPDTHMIAIGKSSAHRDPAGSWLASGDAHRDLDARIGRIVTAHGARARPLVARPRIRRPD